jgi:hypothetical protein
MNSNHVKQMFLDLSVKLTGFNQLELQGTGQLDTYFSLFNKSFPTVLKANFRDEDPMKLREDIQNAYGLPNLATAKSLQDAVITLWYSGLWNGKYANEFAYAEGLMWKTFHAHPPAHKQPGYGSWSIKPLTVK